MQDPALTQVGFVITSLLKSVNSAVLQATHNLTGEMVMLELGRASGRLVVQGRQIRLSQL